VYICIQAVIMSRRLIPDQARRTGGSRARRGAARKFPANYPSDDDDNNTQVAFERFPDTDSETEDMDTNVEHEHASDEEMQVEKDVDVGPEKSDPKKVVLPDIGNESEVRINYLLKFNIVIVILY